MFTMFGLKDGAHNVRQNITIPGTQAFVAKALISAGVPYFHVLDVLSKVSIGSSSIYDNGGPMLLRLIEGCVNARGTLIITKRGIFADTTALRNIVPTFFWDFKNSADTAYIKASMSASHKTHGHVPSCRLVADKLSYSELVCLPAASACFKGAKKQIPAYHLEEIGGYYVSDGATHYLPKPEAEKIVREEAAPVRPDQSEDVDKTVSETAPEVVVENQTTAEEVKTVGELTVDDFLRLAKQLLTTREVTITFSVK